MPSARRRSTFFPKSDHVLNLEEPALFNEMVERFIALVEAGRWGRPRSKVDCWINAVVSGDHPLALSARYARRSAAGIHDRTGRPHHVRVAPGRDRWGGIPAQQRRAKGGPVGERDGAGVQAGPTRGEIDEKPRSNYRCMIILYREFRRPAREAIATIQAM
jgi:hypothetical protein